MEIKKKIDETIEKIKEVIPFKKYNQVKGELIVLKEGKVLIDDIELIDEDIVQIKISTLKQIIQDAKKGLI